MKAPADLAEFLPLDFEPSDGDTGPATISDNRGDIICTLSTEDNGVDDDQGQTIALRETAMRWLVECSRNAAELVKTLQAAHDDLLTVDGRTAEIVRDYIRAAISKAEASN